MTHCSPNPIDQEIQRLSGFIIALFSLLRASRAKPPMDFEEKVNSLIASTDINQELKRDALITFLRMFLGQTYAWSHEQLSEFDDELTERGQPTLSAIRDEVYGSHPPVFLYPN